MHEAIINGQIETAKVLLSSGKVAIDSLNKKGDSCLHLCVKRIVDNNTVVKFLLEEGLDVNILNTVSTILMIQHEILIFFCRIVILQYMNLVKLIIFLVLNI